MALETLPSAKTKTVIVGLDLFRSKYPHYLDKLHQFVGLDRTPEGQALSVREGLTSLSDSGNILVSSCDHGICLDPAKWRDFISDPQCDAAIFCIQNFPGANLRPTAFAYVIPDDQESNSQFPIVKSVSVKIPVSSRPSKDHLLVGTFWFKDKALLADGIESLVKTNQRVNNELYLDSIFNIFIQQGKTIRLIPLDGYFNWGDPDSLAEALYWKEVFIGPKSNVRVRLPGVE
jgi:hypothetical protein